jgi:hypothetical protein
MLVGFVVTNTRRDRNITEDGFGIGVLYIICPAYLPWRRFMTTTKEEDFALGAASWDELGGEDVGSKEDDISDKNAEVSVNTPCQSFSLCTISG